MIATREFTDDEALTTLVSVTGDSNNGWVSASQVQMAFKTHVYDPEAPSVYKVGQRLSRLAREGRCEKRHDEGMAMGMYRRLRET